MDKWSNSIDEYNSAVSDQENNRGTNTLEEYGSDNNGGGKGPKKKGLILKVIIGIVVVFLIGGIVVFSQPTLRNSLYLTVLSPKSYYISTELKNVKKLAENFGDSYEKRVEKLNSQKEGAKRSKTEMKFDMNEQLTTAWGIDEILPIGLLVDSRSDLQKSKGQVSFECTIGKEKLIGADMLMDLGQEGDGDIYMQVPQLSSAYMHTSQKEISEEDEETKKIMEKYQKSYTNYLNNPTTKKFVSNLIIRYGKLIFETPEEVSIEKKAEYSVNNMKKDMTKVTVCITASDAKAWCGKIVEMARNDKELKNEMIRLEICEEDEYSKLIDEMEKIFKEDEEKDTGKLVMDVWVDNRGNILGREISVFDGDKKESGFYYLTDKQDGMDYLEISLYDLEDNTTFVIKGSGKEEESGYKGEAVLESNEGSSTKTRANLSFDKIKPIDDKGSAYNGNFTLQFDSFAGGKLQLTLTGEENKQNVKMEASVKDENICSFEINQSIEDCEEIAYPPEGTIYEMRKSEDMDKYLDSMDETEMSKLGQQFEIIAAVFEQLSGNSQIGESLTGILPTDENGKDEKETEEKEQENEENETGNTSQTNNKELYIIKKAPKTKDDLPKNVELDESGFYSYDVPDEMVKENGEASNAESLFFGVTMKKSSSQIEKLIESVLGKCSKTTESKNSVYGSIGEYASLNTSFLTTDTWNTKGDTYESVRISYDTYSNEINEIVISVEDGKKLDKLVNGFLPLWEKDVDKSYKEYKKQSQKVKNGESESFEAGVTRIYYAPDKSGVYCILGARED